MNYRLSIQLAALLCLTSISRGACQEIHPEKITRDEDALSSKPPSCIKRIQIGGANYISRMWNAYAQQNEDAPLFPLKSWEVLEGGYSDKLQTVVGAHKGFDHDQYGELTPFGLENYKKWISALMEADLIKLEKIDGYRPSVTAPANPVRQAGVLEIFSGHSFGPTSVGITLPDAYPEFSNETAAELVENYCMNLCLDTPFSEYQKEIDNPHSNLHIAKNILNHPKIKQYSAHAPDLRKGYTSNTIFRGTYEGNVYGPYVSQFFLANINVGKISAADVPIWKRVQKYIAPKPLLEISADSAISWGFTPGQAAALLNGLAKEEYKSASNDTKSLKAENLEHKFIYSGRTLANYVSDDPRSQAIYDTSLILADWDVPYNPGLGSNRTLKKPNTYRNLIPTDLNRSPTTAEALSVLFSSSTHTVGYFWKYMTNRRVRAEANGLYVHNHLAGIKEYPWPTWFAEYNNPEGGLKELWDAVANDNEAYRTKYGSLQEIASYTYHVQSRRGCPRHPSYPSVHACAIGGGIAALKVIYNGETKLSSLPVFQIQDKGGGVKGIDSRIANEEDIQFDVDFDLPNTPLGTPIYLEANSDGTKLVVKKMTDIMKNNWTLNHEINKLASNVALARDWLGAHYRSDGMVTIPWAESVALRMFQDIISLSYDDNVVDGGLDAPHVTITKYDGKKETVQPHFCNK